MKRVGIYEAKTRLSALVRDVENGERVIITHRGGDAVELVRVKNDAESALDRLTANETPLGISIAEAIAEGRA